MFTCANKFNFEGIRRGIWTCNVTTQQEKNVEKKLTFVCSVAWNSGILGGIRLGE